MSLELALYIVATPIGNLQELSPRALEILKGVDVIACEDTRNTIKLLSHFDIHTRMVAYHNFNEEKAAAEIVELLKAGQSVALVSDAGFPLISDPGYELTAKAIAANIPLIPISGPNAGLDALVASGLKTDHYLFYGFLNANMSKARKELEALKDLPYTLIFHEAPHRIEKTLKVIYEVFGDREACLARELTKLHEEFIREPLSALCQREGFKGEIVLVVSGCQQEKKTVELAAIKDEIDQLIKKGLRTKDACGEVAKKYQLSKTKLYNDYLKLQ